MSMPEGDAPDPDADALGGSLAVASWTPSHPALVTHEDPRVEPCLIPCGPSWSLSRLPAGPVLRSPLLVRLEMASICMHDAPRNATFSGFLENFGGFNFSSQVNLQQRLVSMFLLTPGGNAHGLNTLRIKELHHFRRRSIFLPKSPSWPRFGPFSAHSADQSAPRAAGARCSPAPKQRASPCWLSCRHSGPNRGRPDQPRVNLARLRLVQLLPAVLIGLLDNSCASGMPGGQVCSCP